MDFVGFIRSVTPDSLQYLVTDDFTRVVVYDNKVTKAEYKMAGSEYNTTIELSSLKYCADTAGKETVVPSDDYVDIGIYKNRTEPIQVQRYKLKGGQTTLSLTLKEKPYKVVIDPRLLLIDKKLDDNEMRFEEKK